MAFVPTKKGASSLMGLTNYEEIRKSTRNTRPKNAASTLPMDTALMVRGVTSSTKRSSSSTIFRESMNSSSR